MKKWKKIVLIVLASLLVILGALAIWQWENIKALAMAVRYSESELQARMEENETKMQGAIDKLPEITFQPLTEEERKRLRDGEMSAEEAVSIVTGKTAEGPAPSDQKEPVDEELEANKARVSELVAQVYVMRDTFTSRLEGIKSAAAADYLALPAEQRTTSAKNAMMMRCMDEASILEAECDAVVEGILTELRELLPKLGQDLSLVDEMKAIYADEKAVKKAYYLNLYS